VRLLGKTDQISFGKIGPLEIIRVGDAGLAEEARWRYGRPASVSRGLLGAIRAGFGRKRPGKLAWRGHRPCPGCGFLFTELPCSDGKILLVTPAESTHGEVTSFSVSRRCPRCRDAHAGGLHLTGVEADFVLARVMAFERPAGVSQDRVRAAVNVIENVGGPPALIQLLTRHGRPLGDLPPVGSIALEIYGDEARERALLRMEAAVLEARWREEEELAAVVDGELTPTSGLRGLKKRMEE
jgi:hypothetical protein